MDPCHTSALVWANGMHSLIEFYALMFVMLLVVAGWAHFRKALRACEGDAN